MIRDIQEKNELTKPQDFEVEKLRKVLPEYFDRDGNFLMDKFQETLSSQEVDIAKEGFELKFLGKSYAKFLTSTATETVVAPDLEHNAKPENKDSENMYIVGDNLDALKHLLGSYAGKIKCIYIDPPYNTGSDGFVYNDDFGFTAKQLEDKIGLSEDEAERIIDLQGKSSHSAWLVFMYPRLQLARELLSDDGVIFISIDDNEQADLRLLCDEIFGEQNFVAGFIVVRSEGGGLAKQAVIGHDYLPAYCKNVSSFSPLGKPKDIRGQVITKDGEDYWVETDWLRKEFGKYGTCPYEEIESILGKKKLEEVDRGLASSDYILVPKRGFHHVGRLRKISDDTSKFYTILKDFDGPGYAKYLNKLGVEDLENLDLAAEFSFPKPVDLVKQIVQGATIHSKNDSDIVLDFFSGSGTSAEAVMRLNAEDSGNRKFIAVQIPEIVEDGKAAARAGYSTIDEIGRERIRRAAKKIKEETGADIDYGFNLFRLDEPSQQIIEQLYEFDPNQSLLFDEDYVSKFATSEATGKDVILTTWLNQDGFGLTAKSHQIELSSYSLDVCGDSAYIIEPGVTTDDVVELVRLVEAGELDISRIVVFGYSVKFNVMHELKKNMNVLKSGRNVKVIERL